MTRLWPEGLPVAVSSTGSIPHQFVWQQQPHPVDAVVKRWRVTVDWWRVRVWRDYFKVTTTTGLLVVLYHDLETDAWFLQRLYD